MEIRRSNIAATRSLVTNFLFARSRNRCISSKQCPLNRRTQVGIRYIPRLPRLTRLRIDPLLGTLYPLYPAMSSKQDIVAFTPNAPTKTVHEIEIENIEGEDHGADGGMDETQKGPEEEEDNLSGQIARDLCPPSKWTLLGVVVVLAWLAFPVLELHGNPQMTVYTGGKWILDSGIEYHITNSLDVFATYHSIQTANVDFLPRNLTTFQPAVIEFPPGECTTTETNPADLFTLSHAYGLVLGYGTIHLHVCPKPASCGSCAATPLLPLVTALYVPSSRYNRISIGQLTSVPGANWYLRSGDFGALGLQGIDKIKNGTWRVSKVEGVISRGVSWVMACGSEEREGERG